MFVSFVSSINFYKAHKLTKTLSQKIKPYQENSYRNSHLEIYIYIYIKGGGGSLWI